MLLGILQGHAQCTVPPPPGYFPIYSIDPDNDGYTTFDIDYYMNTAHRHYLENTFQVSSSGYDLTFYNSVNTHITTPIYTNIAIDEYCTIYYEYSGSGPTFNPLPPCYWPVPTNAIAVLYAIPYNGDKDGDGILNIDEDTNHNLNLMDDDDDHDGIINLEDTSFTLATAEHNALTLNVYPNPVTQGVLQFESAQVITAVTIVDLSGKLLLQQSHPSNTIDLKRVTTGVYFVTFTSAQGTMVKKVVVE